MSRHRAWILNLMAEEELRTPSFRPSKLQRGRVAAWRDRLGRLVEDDLVITTDTPPGAAAGMVGLAWCPTPSALSALRRAGASVLASPSPEILRTVNARGFSAELGQHLPGARFCVTRDAVEACLEATSPSGHWLLKRALSAFGAGRRRIRVGRPSEDEGAWIDASLHAHGGLQVEPWVEVELDVALHGYVHRGGELRLGRPVENRCDPRGAWLDAALDPPLTAAERTALLEEGDRSGRALAAAGYWGPFGIDGFRHRDGFVPRGEINARYSMGWAWGMTDRPDR